MRHVYLLAAAAIFNLTSPAHADQRGNGGGGIVCRDANNAITSVTTLDVYEAAFREIPLDFGPAASTPLEVVNHMLDRLSRIDAHAAENYRKLANRFFDTDISRFRSGITLPFTEDTGPVAPPVGCALEQIVLQSEPEVPEDRLFVVNKDLFDRLDVNNQAALILHEVIYRELLGVVTWDRGEQKYVHVHTNSFTARYFNERLLAQSFTAMTAEEYIATFQPRQMDCDKHTVRWRGIGINLCSSKVAKSEAGWGLVSGALSAAQPTLTLGALRVEVKTIGNSQKGNWATFAVDESDAVDMIKVAACDAARLVNVTAGPNRFLPREENACVDFDLDLAEDMKPKTIEVPDHQLLLNDRIKFDNIEYEKPYFLDLDTDGSLLSSRQAIVRLIAPNSCMQQVEGDVKFTNNTISQVAKGKIQVPFGGHCYVVTGMKDIKLSSDFVLRRASVDVLDPQSPGRWFQVYAPAGQWSSAYLREEITFMETGHVLSGRLHLDRTLYTDQGKQYTFKAGTMLTFNAEGKVVSWN